MIHSTAVDEVIARLDAGESIEVIKTELSKLMEPVIKGMTEFIQDIAKAVGEALEPVIDVLKPLFSGYILACRANPRWAHLAHRHKQKRIRKKWQKRLWKEAILWTR